MQDDDFFYPDAFEFNNVSYSGQRMSSANTRLISISSKDCPFYIGDIVTQKVESKERFFEVLDWQIQTSFDINGKSFVAALIVQSLDVKNKSTTNITDYKF